MREECVRLESIAWVSRSLREIWPRAMFQIWGSSRCYSAQLSSLSILLHESGCALAFLTAGKIHSNTTNVLKKQNKNSWTAENGNSLINMGLYVGWKTSCPHAILQRGYTFPLLTNANCGLMFHNYVSVIMYLMFAKRSRRKKRHLEFCLLLLKKEKGWKEEWLISLKETLCHLNCLFYSISYPEGSV